MLRMSFLVVLLSIALYKLTRCDWERQPRFKLVERHPIAKFMQQARDNFAELGRHETRTLEASIEAYRTRRKREPPEGFDLWHKLAVDSNAMIVEAFWDPIYEDLDLYANESPHLLKTDAIALAESASPLVRGFYVMNGSVSSNCQKRNAPCFQLEAMIRSIAQWLPDTIIPVNSHASPRVFAAHYDVRGPAPASSWLLADQDIPFTVPCDRKAVLKKACTPNPLAAQLETYETTISQRGRLHAKAHLRLSNAAGAPGNWNQDRWRDPCWQPWLMDLHGAFLRPNSLNISHQLLPIFSGARIEGMETALVFPDPLYWDEDPDYHAAIAYGTSWKNKSNVAYWRGSNSGGGHSSEDWTGFHRHRFVALTNASYLQAIKHSEQEDWAQVGIAGIDEMLELARKHVDTGFSAIGCSDDRFQSTNQGCSYLDNHFHPVPWQPLPAMLTMYRYLFDVDGNSFSGRFRTLLLSESVVFKATIFREWHDARLLPWLHFVPISNHFGHDLWDSLEYFLAHEHEGEYIAQSARAWSQKVLRREDMELYLLRLLLEWARLLGT